MRDEFRSGYAIGRSTGFMLGVQVAGYIVNATRDSVRAEHADEQGRRLGYALRLAHELVDEGADPHYVKALLEVGLRAGKPRKRRPAR